MKSTFARAVCRILIAGMIVVPFHAQAGLIGTDQAVSDAHGQDARATVSAIVYRDEVAGQLQALGLTPQAASERVAALSDAEVATLAGRIDALPAGGIAGVLPIVVGALLFYYLVALPLAADNETPKPSAKPVPEKK